MTKTNDRESTRCRHCGSPNVNRPRGLCYTCYNRPSVRVQYAPTSKFALGNFPDRREDFNGPVPLAAEPTDALPGTAEKVAVMTARAAAGVELFHPDDWPAGIGRLLEMVG